MGWFGAIIPACWTQINTVECRAETTEPELFELIGPEDRELGTQGLATPGVDMTMKCERIVGELCFMSTISLTGGHSGPTAHSIWAGIYSTEADASGAVVPWNPGPSGTTVPAEDEKQKWMWLYSWHHPFASEAQPAISVETNQFSPSAHFDIRVKRRLKGREGVYLAVLATYDPLLGTGGIVTYDMRMNGHLRMLLLR